MDKELLNAMSLLMDEKLRPMQQDASGVQKEIADIKQDATGVKQAVTGLKQEVAQLKQEVVKTNILIENEVIGRLDALMDGYMLSHEEITDLKRRVEAIETIVY